jgi:lipopolysaccharide transport system ATP-binding protein
MGLSRKEIDTRFEEIVDFSGIRDFIDQPVKTYSSGMYVRLAFSVAINVDPDILVIDEALSVGDGFFARKSFDRIIALKEAGKTILFCSHSLYQVEALCSRVLWLDKGEMRTLGEPGVVNNSYSAYLDAEEGKNVSAQAESSSEAVATASPPSQSRITSVELRVDGEVGKSALSGESSVAVTVNFVGMEEKRTSVAIAFFTQDKRCVTSASTVNDGTAIQIGKDAHGSATVLFEHIALLKGIYSVTAWLLCDRALFVHDGVRDVCRLEVLQSDLAQGLVRLPHHWDSNQDDDIHISK